MKDTSSFKNSRSASTTWVRSVRKGCKHNGIKRRGSWLLQGSPILKDFLEGQTTSCQRARSKLVILEGAAYFKLKTEENERLSKKIKEMQAHAESLGITWTRRMMC